jgi:hypothetical protein
MGSVEFGKRALNLLKEVAFCTPEGLPPYNVRLSSCSVDGHFGTMLSIQVWRNLWQKLQPQDNQVAAVTEEIVSHDKMMQQIFR